jgi:hypothetical protein
MATIPDVDAMGARPIPQSRRPIVTDRSGEIVGGALAQAGDQLGRFAAVQQERVDRFAYARARSALLQADIAARREIDSDRDFGTYEKRYQERMKKAREAATGMLRDPSDRAAFDDAAGLDIARGALDVNRLAKGRETEWARGELDTMLSANREAALNAGDESTRAALVRATQDAIKGAVAKGYINPDDGSRIQRTWAAEYGEGVVEMLPAEEQVRLLSNPKGTAADFIDPAKRSSMLAAAQRDIEVEARLRASEARAAEAAAYTAHQRAQDHAADLAYQHFAAGNSVASVPKAVWRQMDGRTQVALQNLEEQRTTGSNPVTDRTAYYALETMARNDPDAFAARNLVFDSPYLSDTDFKHFVGLQTEMETEAGKLEVGTLNNLIDVTVADGKVPSENKARFTMVANAAVSAEQGRLKRKLTMDEKQAVVDRLLIEGEVDGSGWLWDDEKRAYELTPEEAESFVPEGVPEDDAAQIREALKKAGKPVTAAAILRAYEIGQAQR